jgi:hypothetical protein
MPLDETTATVQFKAAGGIAGERFNFPNEEYPDLETHVNVPTLKMPVQGPGGELLGPDIAVVSKDGVLQMVAAVETVHTINAASARQRWAKFAELGVPFYLYVPAGYADQAKKLLKQTSVKTAKLRTWRYIAGLDWTLDLTDITHDFSINDLVPPFLVRWMEQRRARAAAGRAEREAEKAKQREEEEARLQALREAEQATAAAREAERAAEPQYPHTTAPRP